MPCCEPSPEELSTWGSVLLCSLSSCRIQPYIPEIQPQHQSAASYCSAWGINLFQNPFSFSCCSNTHHVWAGYKRCPTYTHPHVFLFKLLLGEGREGKKKKKRKEKSEAIDSRNLHFPGRAPEVPHHCQAAEERAQAGFKSRQKGRT